MDSNQDLPAVLLDLDRLTREHPFDRKLLVARRPAEGRELLHSLSMAGTAWIGWESISPRQLAHDVVALELAESGIRTADAFDVMALVEDAIDAVVAAGETGPFRREVPSVYRDPIRRTIESLRRAGVTPGVILNAATRDPKLRMLAAVLAAYESSLTERRLLDGPGLMTRAAETLERSAATAAPGAMAAALPDGRLFLLPGLSLRGVEGRFVRRLMDAGARPLRTDPVLGLPLPTGVVWNAPEEPTGALSRLHAVPRSDGDDGSGPSHDLRLFAAATPADEIREVLRRVVAAGIPWDRVEIVAVDPDVYGAALDGLSRRLDIPVTYAAGLDVRRTRVGRAVEAYFQWIGNGFPADPIRQLLETGDLAAAELAPQSSPAALARRLRRLRIGWGYDRYLRAIDRALQALARGDAHRDGDGGEEDDIAAAREREREELEALRSILAPVLEATPRLPDRHVDNARTSPARVAEGLLALLNRVPAGDAVENTARTMIEGRLHRARGSLTRETGWGAAISILRSRLETRLSPTAEAGRLAPWTSTGGRLHLSDITTGGLAARPHTFVVGLAAGAAGGGAPDPLLPESDRVRLDPAALPSMAERLAESRHELGAMLARLRGTVTLSYSAWDMTEGRAIAPAPELLQALRLRERDPSLTYEALRKRMGGLACPVPSTPDGAAGEDGALLDAADVWLSALSTKDGRLREGRSAVRALHPGLDRGLAAAATRNESGSVTEYHGRVTPDPALDPATGSIVFSASRLEKLGKCPLQYFYRYVLAIRPVQDPAYDPESWLDPLERGSLLHAVYERAVEEWPVVGGAQEFGDEAFAHHALAILGEEVRRTLQRLPAPNEAVLAAEQDALEADVRSFVAMLRDQRPRVLRTELSFGPDADSEGEVALDVPAGRIRLRGRIDRLDEIPGGGLRIVDYKTGGGERYLDALPFDGGRRLQHLLYALAVERLRPEDRVEAMEYHFPTVRGENHVTSYPRHVLEGGHSVLDTLLGLARSGHFLATTDPKDCRYCDFGEICHVRPDDFGGAASPRAEWAKRVGKETPEYAPLVMLREEGHG